MRNANGSSERWNLVPMDPRTTASFRRWNIVIISFLAFLVIGVFVAALPTGLEVDMSAADKVPLKIDKNPAPVSLAEFQNGYATVINPALPAVVNISSSKMVKQQNDFSGLLSGPCFQPFFGDQLDRRPSGPETEGEYSLGSGVVVNADGYILTNDHVVSGAPDIEVFTQDKRKFTAKVIGMDPRTDIAVLKIDARGLPALTLGDSSRLKIGDVVFAVGDPFGVGETATMGIVSAAGRALGGAVEHYEDFIQTDAAITPGNSGGALLDLHGNLVGINIAIVSSSGSGNQGVGLAIPIDMARNVMEQIAEHGKVVRGHLGVALQSVDTEMAKALGLTHGGGAVVSDVTAGSPAAKAGIQRGDIIRSWNGKGVGGPDDLSIQVSETAPGTTVRMKIARGGRTRDVAVTLDELSEKSEALAGGAPGIQVKNLATAIPPHLGMPAAAVAVAPVDSSQCSCSGGSGTRRDNPLYPQGTVPVEEL